MLSESGFFFMPWLARFRIPESGSTTRLEVLGGATTFLSMSYIIVVNPSILSTGTGMPFSGVMAATVLTASVNSILMGIWANLPYAVAPGMGLNAFLAFTVIGAMGVAWKTALGMVVLSGVLFLAVSATPLRETIARSIPHGIRRGAAGGIGLFLTLIGLKNAGVVVPDSATLVRMGHLSPTILFLTLGLVITGILLYRRWASALLVGIVLTTLLALPAGRLWPGSVLVPWPESLIAWPDFQSVMLQADLRDALRPVLFPSICVLMLTDLFDSLSTFLGLATAANLVDKDGEPKNVGRALTVDAAATFSAGVFGSSPGTAYIESAAGIEAGARTGLASVVTGLLFLLLLFISPLASCIPQFATAPALIVVGLFMLRGVVSFAADEYPSSIPAYLTMVLIPMTFSITKGILAGLITHVLLNLLCGRGSEIKPVLWILAVVAGVLLALDL
jgi:AGZA family xanthine/uracil permease-like MFS transporter